MWKVTIGLFTLAVLLTTLFLMHGLITGIGVPCQDPTPEQSLYERNHHAISDWLILAVIAPWPLTLLVTAVSVAKHCVRRWE